MVGKDKELSFSLEVFPAKTVKAQENFWQAIKLLKSLHPAFFSVTSSYNSQISSQTKDLVLKLQNITRSPVAAHMLTVNQTTDELRQLAENYWECGIKKIVALRGDVAADSLQKHKPKHAAELVKILKGVNDFDISVAGYPEKHPEAESLTEDIDYLKAKVDNGADRVITQFFFDPDIFLEFRDKAVARGIKVPIIPGILPILNFEKLVTFAERCQANVPGFLRSMFAEPVPAGSDEALNSRLLSMNVLSHQVTKLIINGVKHFHFYTLNETVLTCQICRWLNIAF